MLFLPPAIKCGIAVAGLAASLMMGTMGISNIDQSHQSEIVLQAPISGQVNVKGYPVIYEVSTTKKGGVTIKYNKKDGVANFEYHRDTDAIISLDERFYLEQILQDILKGETPKGISAKAKDLLKETYAAISSHVKRKPVKN